MRRFLLSMSALLSLPLIALTGMMWSRSFGTMDWCRISALDRAAVFASSRAHVGAAIVLDADVWSIPEARMRLRHLRAADLRRQFARNFCGFGYREEDGIKLILFPMWSLLLLGITPLLLWIGQRPRKRLPS